MLNKVTLIGNLGNDPEIISIDGKQSFAKLSLATNKKWKNEEGKEVVKTTWHSVSVFTPSTVKYLSDNTNIKKGDLILVEGELDSRKVEREDGSNYTATSVLLGGNNSNLRLLKSSPGNDDLKAEQPQQEVEELRF